MASSQPDPGVAIFAHIPLKHSVEEEKQIALAFGKQRDSMQRGGGVRAVRALTTFIFFRTLYPVVGVPREEKRRAFVAAQARAQARARARANLLAR